MTYLYVSKHIFLVVFIILFNFKSSYWLSLELYEGIRNKATKFECYLIYGAYNIE